MFATYAETHAWQFRHIILCILLSKKRFDEKGISVFHGQKNGWPVENLEKNLVVGPAEKIYALQMVELIRSMAKINPSERISIGKYSLRQSNQQ